MVRIVKSFRLSRHEAEFIKMLAERHGISEAEILRTMIYTFMKDVSKKDLLEEDLKQVAEKHMRKKVLKEIREEGKWLLKKATWKVRMLRFYNRLVSAGVTWDEFEDSIDSWIKEAKFLNIDQETIDDALYSLAELYYHKRHDIDLDRGYERLYKRFVKGLEVEADGGDKKEKVGKAL